MTNKSANIIIFIFFGLSLISFAQQRNNLSNTPAKKQSPIVQLVFNQIEEAISNSNVAALSQYFSPHTYFSLSNGISGYYSSNQAYYILEDYFKIYRVISFRFNNVQSAEDKPYATGVYNFEFKGKRDVSRVYISLKIKNDNWKITQITIN